MIDRGAKLHRRIGRERAPVRYCSFETSSSSQANQTSTQTSTDARVVGGNDSTNVSAQNSTVQLVDQGAVKASFGFAQNAFDDAIRGITQSVSDVKDAYSTAKAGEQKVLVAVGVVLVSIVAFQAVKK